MATTNRIKNVKSSSKPQNGTAEQAPARAPRSARAREELAESFVYHDQWTKEKVDARAMFALLRGRIADLLCGLVDDGLVNRVRVELNSLDLDEVAACYEDRLEFTFDLAQTDPDKPLAFSKMTLTLAPEGN